ncbi:mitochondrial transport protein-like protein [Emericellopsis cladophorae]|uniref:Mitochondrial transport protein-like protein n=1 Tax=Emericellopsis cladophorae TaxID=2686198 RepID=A0A9Q0BD28_9HYPO|nr:mitochondrial transport protein-like protein [Emericellopsis cladophorae]KAI6780125.1 mitochondrial transport protein-like protein [Emericellopsis cladophorae]
MSASLPGSRELPQSQYDLKTYMGRVRHSVGMTDPSTLFAGSSGLEKAKRLVTDYKTGKIENMSPELWHAKKVVDSTLHPDTGEPVLLPFRMSSFVLSNLVVTAGMLQPGLSTLGTVGWQVANQSLNVAINTANANKSSPMTTADMAKSYAVAVSASCSVALGLNAVVPRLKVSPGARNILKRLVPFAAVASAGALNAYLMRRGEIVTGIDVKPVLSDAEKKKLQEESKSERDVPSLGRSQKAAKLAVYETAASRVFNNSPIMILPAMGLYYIESKANWYKNILEKEFFKARPRARAALPIGLNLGLIAATSFCALPLALAVFPQQQEISADKLEPEFHGKGGVDGKVIFNRGL